MNKQMPSSKLVQMSKNILRFRLLNQPKGECLHTGHIVTLAIIPTIIPNSMLQENNIIMHRKEFISQKLFFVSMASH